MVMDLFPFAMRAAIRTTLLQASSSFCGVVGGPSTSYIAIELLIYPVCVLFSPGAPRRSAYNGPLSTLCTLYSLHIPPMCPGIVLRPT